MKTTILSLATLLAIALMSPRVLAQDLSQPAQVAEDNAVQVVEHLSQRFAQDGAPMSWQDFYLLSYGLFFDGQLDAMENDLLDKLGQSDGQAINVALDGGHILTLPPADGEARRIAALLADVPNMNDWWMVSDVTMSNLVLVAYSGEAAWDRVAAFYASKFFDAWKASNTQNGYRPLRDLIVESFTFYDREGFVGIVGRGLLFDAITLVDQYENDLVPDFTYNWLKPGEEQYRPYDRLEEARASQ